MALADSDGELAAAKMHSTPPICWHVLGQKLGYVTVAEREITVILPVSVITSKWLLLHSFIHSFILQSLGAS